MRSLWEADFAALLDAVGAVWEYEPARLNVVGASYTPDFLVTTPFGPAYVELHRLDRQVCGKPRDARKIAMLLDLEATGIHGVPLVLLDQRDISVVRAHLRKLTHDSIHDEDRARL